MQPLEVGQRRAATTVKVEEATQQEAQGARHQTCHQALRRMRGEGLHGLEWKGRGRTRGALQAAGTQRLLQELDP